MSVQRNRLAVMIALLLAASTAGAQELKFSDYRSAMAAGVGLYNSGNLAASQQPLEAAVELAGTERQKNDAYSPLIKVYSETGDFDKMFEAAEYIVANATYPAKASLTVRSLIANCHRKNQLDTMQKRYVELLDKNAKDRVALTIMAAFHQNVNRDYGKRAEYLRRLIDLDKEENKEPNAELLADLAFAYKLSREYKRSAELYEQTAPISKQLESSCYMEAAEAWDKADNKAKSLAAAEMAHKIGPDKRANHSLYRWHRTLGEIFLAHKMKKEALHHLQAALDDGPIETYKKQLAELIESAEAL